MSGDPKDRQFWADMLARIRKRTRTDQDAEDLLHSAWLRLFAYREEHEVRQPVAFMVQTAAHLAIDRHRQVQRTNSQSIENFSATLEDNSPLQDEVLASRVRLQRVREGLSRLTPRTREVFLMHRLDDLKYREIAERLGISQSAVEKHIAKAALFLTEWTEGW